MGVALQVMLLVVAIVVAVAGIGVALALRMSARQRAQGRGRVPQAHKPALVHKPAATHKPAQGHKASPDPKSALARARAVAAAEAAAPRPAAPATPEEAHKAKLEALQALLALGDAKADAAESSMKFEDTQPAGNEYATTQFVEGRGQPGSLLDLDKIPPKRKDTRR